MAKQGIRVTGGELGGRRLRSVASGVRPTADRVRQSLFQRLGDLAGTAVLDLYAGSGVMGVEALSRGASRVVFVERDPKVLALLRQNIAALGLEAQVEMVRGDAVRSVPRLARAGECFDLVLLDPPYESGELGKALPALAEGLVVAEEGTLVVEHGRRHPVPESSDWAVLEEWPYGETQVTLLRRAAVRTAGGREA